MCLSSSASRKTLACFEEFCFFFLSPSYVKEEFRVCKKFVILNFSLCFLFDFPHHNKSHRVSPLFALVCLHLFCCGCWKRRTQKKDGGRKNEFALLTFFSLLKECRRVFSARRKKRFESNSREQIHFPIIIIRNEREHIIGREDGRDEEEEATGELQRRFL